jgi:hypothetical protein
MSEWSGLGKALIVAGGFVVLIGLLLVLAGRFLGSGGLGWLGRLPGDIFIKQDHVTLYFPLATSLLLSVVLSLILYLLSKW